MHDYSPVIFFIVIGNTVITSNWKEACSYACTAIKYQTRFIMLYISYMNNRQTKPITIKQSSTQVKYLR